MTEGTADKKAAPQGAGTCQVFLVHQGRVKRARDAMLPEDALQQVAEIFKVLANPTRLRIILALAREEFCVCDIAQLLGLSDSATSHQLQILRRLGLVSYRMEGKLAYYSLRDPFVLALLKDGLRHLDVDVDAMAVKEI